MKNGDLPIIWAVQVYSSWHHCLLLGRVEFPGGLGGHLPAVEG